MLARPVSGRLRATVLALCEALGGRFRAEHHGLTREPAAAAIGTMFRQEQ